MAGMVADIGERLIRPRRKPVPRKLIVVFLTAFGLMSSLLILDASGSGSSEPAAASGWRTETVYLKQLSMRTSTAPNYSMVTCQFRWNDSYDFAELNWSTVDKERTDQKYVLGLGAKIWVTSAALTTNLSMEVVQGDGTSLDYQFTYAKDRASPHIYLTGERTFWKWNRTPDVVYDYRVRGSCAIEDAWCNNTWTPEEGIMLKYDKGGTLAFGKCDFAVLLLVYDTMVPEFGVLMPSIALATIMVFLARRRIGEMPRAPRN